MSTPFATAVRTASLLPDLRATIHQLYESLQSQIDIRRPLCQSSGRCCHFDEFGHRLYVTTAEMATFLHDLAPLPPLPAHPLAVLPGCRFQLDGLCSVHSIRPFGCRIFFCDASSTQWQHEQYEAFHRQLQQIHQQYKVPYFYMEWRTALAELGL